MKVTNSPLGQPKVDTAKTGKSDASVGVGKDLKTTGLNSKAALKDAANVNLSERAQLMQKAKEIAGQPTQVDDAKVARLQKMIDEGKYKVDSQSIADRLVDEHLAFED